MIFKEGNKNRDPNLKMGIVFIKIHQIKIHVFHIRKKVELVWDTPCKYDEECPFYKKNMNYIPNSTRHCKNGFCEMPVNIATLGFKEYNESGKNAAICYNCNYKLGCDFKECGQCCEDQKDISLYPNLKSPDYAFNNDYFERIKHTKTFKEKDMAPIKITI